MARVFQGKSAIPGDQIDAFLEALGQFEHEKAPLRSQLEQYARDFAHALAQQYVPSSPLGRRRDASGGLMPLVARSDDAGP